jgi:hypothetical protein
MSLLKLFHLTIPPHKRHLGTFSSQLQKFFIPTGGWHIKIEHLLYEALFSSKVLRNSFIEARQLTLPDVNSLFLFVICYDFVISHTWNLASYLTWLLPILNSLLCGHVVVEIMRPFEAMFERREGIGLINSRFFFLNGYLLSQRESTNGPIRAS